MVGAQTFGGALMTIDDIYVCTGDDPFLGDIIVETLYPNGNGTVNQWVGTDANSVDNYLLVDDQNTSDSVRDSVPGHQDLYVLQNLSVADASVVGVAHEAYVRKGDVGRGVPAAQRGGGGHQRGDPHTERSLVRLPVLPHRQPGHRRGVHGRRGQRVAKRDRDCVTTVLIEPFANLLRWTNSSGASIVVGDRTGTCVQIGTAAARDGAPPPPG